MNKQMQNNRRGVERKLLPRFIMVILAIQIILGIAIFAQQKKGTENSAQDSNPGSAQEQIQEQVPEQVSGQIQEQIQEQIREQTPGQVREQAQEQNGEQAQEQTGEQNGEQAQEQAKLPEQNQAQIQEKEEKNVVHLIMVGDILLHTPIEKASLLEDGTYDYSPLFQNTKELISGADIALVNQEVILGGEQLGVSGYPAFNAPYAVGDDLVEAGFDVILHATNHALDKGRKGLLNCLNFWKENYPEIGVLGIHDSQEDADALYVFEQEGIRIAILNYSYGTNGIELPSDMPYGVDYLREEEVREDIRKARAAADFVIICPHWGTEYSLQPDSSQKKWTKIFKEEGVDLVIGTHPHVIEPVVWVLDDGSTIQAEADVLQEGMLVYYSLGNYVNWTSGTGDAVSNRMVGGMAQIDLEKSEEGKVKISGFGVTALVAHVTEGTGGVTVYPLEQYSSQLAMENAIISQSSTFSYEYCVSLCDQVWGNLWQNGN